MTVMVIFKYLVSALVSEHLVNSTMLSRI